MPHPKPSRREQRPDSDPDRIVEWVDTDGLPVVEGDDGRVVDTGAAWRRIRKVFGNDESAYVDLVDGEAISGAVVAVSSIFAAALGGWLFVAVSGHDALSITRVIVASVLLGTIVATVAWVGWVLIVRWWLEGRGHEVDGIRLLAAMGFATAPFSVALLMVTVIPAFGIAIVSLVWWFVASTGAIAAVVPDAPPGRIRKANLAGFAAFVLVLGLLAFAGGIAPGPFVFGRF